MLPFCLFQPFGDGDIDCVCTSATCEGAACTGAGCTWTCSAIDIEFCGNNVDDDGDGFVDCDDSGCQLLGSITQAEAEGVYNCLGTSKTGEFVYPPGDYYCGEPEAAVGVGLCCPVGQKPEYNAFLSTWSCVDSDPCQVPFGFCDYDYTAGTFGEWLGDLGCLDPIAPLACCEIVKFGEFDYYDDNGNIKVY